MANKKDFLKMSAALSAFGLVSVITVLAGCLGAPAPNKNYMDSSMAVGDHAIVSTDHHVIGIEIDGVAAENILSNGKTKDRLFLLPPGQHTIVCMVFQQPADVGYRVYYSGIPKLNPGVTSITQASMRGTFTLNFESGHFYYLTAADAQNLVLVDETDLASTYVDGGGWRVEEQAKVKTKLGL
jgi:hypothetical protein